MKSLRRSTVIASGAYSKSHLFNLIEDGLFTPSVRLGARLTVWPEYEANAIHSAGIAGWSESSVKRLVADLLNLRKETPGMTDDEINAAVSEIVKRVGPSPAAAA